MAGGVAGTLRRGTTAVFVDRSLYPARRVQPLTLREPEGVLDDLGFDAEEVGAYRLDWEARLGERRGELAERGRRIGGPSFEQGWLNPSRYGADARTLVYLAVRLTRPQIVVETGTYAGNLSTVILLGLADNGGGRLVSLDLPARVPIKHATDEALPAGRDPGWIVPDDLRANYEIVLGDSRRTLIPTLERLGRLDLFSHDSLHTRRHMLFEYREAWKRLPPGGLLLSDDAFYTSAFWWFTRRNRVPFRHVGGFAATRKPLTPESL